MALGRPGSESKHAVKLPGKKTWNLFLLNNDEWAQYQRGGL